MASIRRSLLLSFLDKYSALCINIVANLALARILTPYDIGIYSIAASLVGFAAALRDFGVASYLLQERELTVIRQRSAIGVAIVITWTVGGILASLSAVIADYYNETGVRNVILVSSINFLFIPLTTVVITMLRREMNFGAIYRINFVASLARAIVALGLAILGFGFMSLAWSSVAGAATIFVMTQIELPAAGRLLPSLREAHHIVRFGALSTIGQVLGEISVAAPNIIIGRMISPTAVGLYSRAFGMITLFGQAILEGVSPVAVSAIAMRHRQGSDIRALWINSLTHISAFGWPFFSFVAIMTFPVVRILFGDQWDAAVPVARLICVGAMIGLLDTMTWATLQGTGSVGKYAVLQFFTVPMQVALLIAALIYERDLVAAGWTVIFGAIVHVIASLFFLRRLIGVRIVDVFGALKKSAVLTVLTCIAPALAIILLPVGPQNLWFPVLLAAAGSGMMFIAGVFVLRHPLAGELREALSHGWRYVAG